MDWYFWVLLVIGVVLFIAGFKLTSVYEVERGGICVTVGLILLIGSVWAGLAVDHNKDIKLAQERIDQGAKIYLEGQEVDEDDIFLEDYVIKFKNGNVILSNDWN